MFFSLSWPWSLQFSTTTSSSFHPLLISASSLSAPSLSFPFCNHCYCSVSLEVYSCLTLVLFRSLSSSFNRPSSLPSPLFFQLQAEAITSSAFLLGSARCTSSSPGCSPSSCVSRCCELRSVQLLFLPLLTSWPLTRLLYPWCEVCSCLLFSEQRQPAQAEELPCCQEPSSSISFSPPLAAQVNM